MRRVGVPRGVGGLRILDGVALRLVDLGPLSNALSVIPPVAAVVERAIVKTPDGEMVVRRGVGDRKLLVVVGVRGNIEELANSAATPLF